MNTPDTQDLSDEADAYDRLIETTIPLRISEVAGKNVKAWLLPLDDGPGLIPPNLFEQIKNGIRALDASRKAMTPRD